MTMLSKLPQIAVGLLAACVLAVMAVTVSACGPDHEQAIRDALTQELDQIKNVDDAYIQELSADAGIEELADLGIDPAEFFRSFLSGFEYVIDDVVVEEETATATVTLSMKSFTEFSSSLESQVAEMLQDESIASMSEEDVYKALGERVMTSLDSLQVTQMDPITISYQLIDGSWTPTEESTQSIESAMLSH